MKQEFDWSNIVEVASKRRTCISSTGTNHRRAFEDFANHPYKVSYFTFFCGKGRGYMRTITEDNRIFVDYITPYGAGISEIVLRHFARKVSLPVYIYEGSTPSNFKTAEAERIDHLNIGQGIKQRVYTLKSGKAIRIPG